MDTSRWSGMRVKMVVSGTKSATVFMGRAFLVGSDRAATLAAVKKLEAKRLEAPTVAHLGLFVCPTNEGRAHGRLTLSATRSRLCASESATAL